MRPFLRTTLGMLLAAAMAGCASTSAGRDDGRVATLTDSDGMGIRIAVTSVLVQDQAAALDFYTDKLGFIKKHDVAVGEFRYLTLVSPLDPDGTELLLEPDAHPAARAFQAAIYADGIPATSFEVEDIVAEHQRLAARGVRFRLPPTDAGTSMVAIFEDTCGNLIQLHEVFEMPDA